MIKFACDVDPSITAVHDALARLALEYGSVGSMGHDTFKLICGEVNSTFCQKVIDSKDLRMYRIELIVLPPEMLAGRNAWCLVRHGREGVWSSGAV